MAQKTTKPGKKTSLGDLIRRTLGAAAEETAAPAPKSAPKPAGKAPKPAAGRAKKPHPAAKGPNRGTAKAKPAGKEPASPKREVESRKTVSPVLVKREEKLKQADEGYQLAKTNAVKYLHTRRQAVFGIARHYHLEPEDLQQESYEVLLTCLRDFSPVFTRAGGERVTVQFNTFFGNRLEAKALEMRNRDPEYQARQAHMADMSDADREQFRKDPPLLVQHLDHDSAMQEHLRGEVSAAQKSRQSDVRMKIVQDSFIEKKLNELIAAERDDKRRAALMHVKVGGVASFEEIAYHFGVTDSRASQILNELMDAFYVQRLLENDIKSVVYDFRKLNLQEKRAQRLLEEAIGSATPARAAEIAEAFGGDFPTLRDTLAEASRTASLRPTLTEQGSEGPVVSVQLTEDEEKQFPLQGVEWRALPTLTTLDLSFRPASSVAPENLPHIRTITSGEPESWPPLLITPEGAVIDGERRIHAAHARGVDRLLCQVRAVPSVKEAQTLRIVLNSRVRALDKLELYFAISALLTLGQSQSRIAELLGTSRPNVIVYAKVREKASPRLRQLYEDGMIQITNASSAVDLPPAAQDEMADFIRQYGAGWGRGPQFAELYEAAAAGQIRQLAPAAEDLPAPMPGGSRIPSSVTPFPSFSVIPGASQQPEISRNQPENSPANTPVCPPQPDGLVPSVANALKRRQEQLESALRDTEVWLKQREATILQQTEQIQSLKQNIESLQSELEAHNLLEKADEATMASYIKEIKAFYAVQERLASAAHQLEKGSAQLRSLHLTHRQALELEDILEKLATHENSLRVAILSRTGALSPTGKQGKNS